MKKVGTFGLVFIIYFSTSGGPHTVEALVQEIGPGMAALMLLLVPLLWSVPEVLIVGELSSMLPVEGGYYRWVDRAFGRFWAFQNGWLTWMYSLVDMAIYPILFNQYLAWFVPELGSLARWLIALGVIWVPTMINLRGAVPVGRISIVAGLFIIVGFAVASFAAIPNIDHNPLIPFGGAAGGGGNGLAVGLSIALWNFIGWDNASTVEGEVKDAGRTYPRALAITLPLVMVGYFLPLLTTLGATDWTTWRDGGWPEIVNSAVGGGGFGRFMAAWVAIGGMVSALALFNALLLSYSRIPFVMARDGLLPPALTKTDRHGTPVNAVLFAAGLYSFFALLPFGQLIVADVVLYALALSLEFGALIALRRKEPDLRGSFRIPLGRSGVIVLALLPLSILVTVVGLSFRDGEYGLPAIIGAAVAIALGPLVYASAKNLYGR
ncbi:MAG: APC family permease [Gemmatimonadaceae bacterium]